MDLLTIAITQAVLYAITSDDSNTAGLVTANWTALNETTWWGPADQEDSQDTAIYSTKITFEDDMIDDLRKRLRRNITYVAPLDDTNFVYGFNRDQLSNWTTYWAEEYDFKAREEYLNQFPMYKTNIQGIDIFFIRVTPTVPDGVEVVPMLLLHGFPGGLTEFYDAIPVLSAVSDDRDFALELIIPCLPGYGYSGRTFRKGMGAAQVAIIMNSFMLRLGFDKYYVQGGDFGAVISNYMSTLFPEAVLGHHTNMAHVLAPIPFLLQMVGAFMPSLFSTSEDYNRMYPLTDIFLNTFRMTGYLHYQATKPFTIATALTDSPAGLLAYNFDLIMRFNNNDDINKDDGGLYDLFTRDQLIDLLMFYWAPQSTATAMTLYSEFFNKKQFALKMDQISTPVPTCVIQALHEIWYQPAPILRIKYPNLLNATVLDYGGHFLSVEYPEVFAESVLTAVTAFRKWHLENDC